MSTHRHSHDHHTDRTDLDWAVMAVELERGAELQLPFLEAAAARLRELLPDPARVGRVLDIGSGPGVMSGVLAQVFPHAEIVAVDGTPALLERAGARAERLGVAGRLVTVHTELPGGLDSLGTADLVWTSRVVHHLGDQQAVLDALARSLRPGGLLAVAEGGLPVRFLPRDIGIGRPGLQARLDAAAEEWFDDMRTAMPDHATVVEDWPAMLTRAGLTPAGAHSFLTDRPAPLDEPARVYLRAHLARLRELMDETLHAEDRATLDRLLDDGSPDAILRRPDAFYLAASTVFTARSKPSES
jgi:SAM-dependent methyltransferase